MPVRKPNKRLRIAPELREAYKALNDSLDTLLKELEINEQNRKELTKELDKEKEILENKIERLQNIILTFLPKDFNEYDKDAGWKQKILWVLKTSDRLLPVSTIVRKIKENEENLENDITPIIRLTCKRMVEKNELKEYNNPNIKGQHFGLLEWFSDKEELLESHYF